MSFRSSVSWLGAAQLVGFVLQFATSVVFARYLSPHEMGIYAIAVALVGFLSIIQQLSLPALIVREENLTDDFLRTAFTLNGVLTVLFALLIVGAGVLGGSSLGDPGVRNVLFVLAISPLLGTLSFLPMARLEREGRFRALAMIGTAAIVTHAAVGTVLVMTGGGYLSIAWAQLAYGIVYSAGAMMAGRGFNQFRPGWRASRRILGFSVQMLAVSGAHQAQSRVTELVLGRMLGLSALGLFNRANGLNSLVWQNLAGIVSRVLLVNFAETHRAQVSLRDRYLQTNAVMTAVLWPAFAGLAVVAKPFIVLVYGPQWVPAVVPLAFLAISSILLTSITMTWELFTATGRLKEQTRIETIRVVIGTGMFALGCLHSLEVAAATRVLDAALAIVIYRPHVLAMTDTEGRDFRRIYLQSAAATLLAIGPAAVVMLASGDGLPPIALLVAAVMVGMALWASAILLFDYPLAPDLRRVKERILRPLLRRTRVPASEGSGS